MKKYNALLINGLLDKTNHQNAVGEQIHFNGELFYKISNVANMRPFFMSIVSSNDHWLFLSSNGGISAGRSNSNNALFPYITDDKITDNIENTGSKSIFIVHKGSKKFLWEPFSPRHDGIYDCENNLYKNFKGNKAIFEEVNHDLRISFSYEWTTSKKFGFVRTARFKNLSGSKIKVEFVDGIQNIMPWGVEEALQNSTSNLVDAYKRSELDRHSKLGIFALSAVIIDRAEPSEALKSNVVWSPDFKNTNRLLSSAQLQKFRTGHKLENEDDVKGERGAYFINSSFSLGAKSHKNWTILADVNKDASGVTQLISQIRKNRKLHQEVLTDAEDGSNELTKLVAAADGLQLTEDSNRNARHFANVLFNIMRGGIFDNNYQVRRDDFIQYLGKANKKILTKYKDKLNQLPNTFHLKKLLKLSDHANDDFYRLAHEYLPLKFSRRHGDPSRPWNKFDINMTDETTGKDVLDYQGNWRDIFQNWEALAQSYPSFINSMIFRFLNASTFEGYNPYRVTKDGFDWERIEPDNPWAYIGYWGDHQIIYLLKLLEFSNKHNPDHMSELLNRSCFVYANVPYKIKSHTQIMKDPKNTIDYDFAEADKIDKAKNKIGSDGALLANSKDALVRATLAEKLLVTLLAKISNFIPEAGIWLNTQRPEWNDANNALVGNGVSMVTLFYLRRFSKYLVDLLMDFNGSDLVISHELRTYFLSVSKIFNEAKLRSTDKSRFEVVNKLGKAGSLYRNKIYKNKFTGQHVEIPKADVIAFLASLNEHLDHAIKMNKRSDNLYHAYNLLTIDKDKVKISHLPEMLEGQVAALSSGKINPKQAVALLDSLKNSELYRKDQLSYILYPAKKLPGFLEKNIIPKKLVHSSKLLVKLLKDKNKTIIVKDSKGIFHFNGNFNNADALGLALDQLPDTYSALLQNDKAKVCAIYEKVFDHKSFTGRSGTFYGYEGLGSIYWHMVSKLLIAVQELIQKAIDEKAGVRVINKLKKHYFEINKGIGADKTPLEYGAIPTDPYSHTPAGKGAQQPGMTGQVKEDIIARMAELGVETSNGQISFSNAIFTENEYLTKRANFEYINTKGHRSIIELKKGSLAFTICQTPVIYQRSRKSLIEITYSSGETEKITGLLLPQNISKKIFGRDGAIKKIIVSFQN